METNISGFECRQGKIRDNYDIGDGKLVMIATDRISAFDVIMANGIPNKGEILTRITEFWMYNLWPETVPNHLIVTDTCLPGGLPEVFRKPEFKGRFVLCQKTQVLPVECIVRGYITGSGWKEYQRTGKVCGISLPSHLEECAKLSEPIFTPSIKVETGHDENICFADACGLIGKKTAEEIRSWSIKLYKLAHKFAGERGIIIADTKFEFGIVEDRIILINEILTPDSSRFWSTNDYKPGRPQFSFDKQFVRDYLQKLCDIGVWNKEPPGPTLPEDVVQTTQARYLDIFRRLTGQTLQV